MPTYEYVCTACATRFERRQSMTEEPVQSCPECAGAVRRVLFPVGIVFKGSGFYVTDSRKSNGKDGDSDKAPARSESTAKTESPSKSESAPKSDSTSKSDSASGEKKSVASATA